MCCGKSVTRSPSSSPIQGREPQQVGYTRQILPRQIQRQTVRVPRPIANQSAPVKKCSKCGWPMYKFAHKNVIDAPGRMTFNLMCLNSRCKNQEQA